MIMPSPPPTLVVVVDGTPHRVRLRMPTAGDAQVLLVDASLHRSASALASARRIELYDLLATVNDEPATWAFAAEIADESDAVQALRTARDGWLAAEVRRGQVVEGPDPTPIDPGPSLAPPALAQLPDPAHRLSRPDTAQPMEVVLPSGATGTLDWLDPLVEAQAWDRWAPVGLDPLPEHEDWTFESAGFRAILRLRCALVHLGARDRDDLAPDDIEALPLADFLFLDRLYGAVFKDDHA
ncbi:hypothetical protein ACH3VR_03955 [Microbacterium sp. B2969]|uniref:Uncharacterized protein n=1 Tax=Microbacterium alkaliflavum TaxID=3248839 RepID=A0ABW7Q3T6_9MICO